MFATIFEVTFLRGRCCRPVQARRVLLICPAGRDRHGRTARIGLASQRNWRVRCRSSFRGCGRRREAVESFGPGFPRVPAHGRGDGSEVERVMRASAGTWVISTLPANAALYPNTPIASITAAVDAVMAVICTAHFSCKICLLISSPTLRQGCLSSITGPRSRRGGALCCDRPVSSARARPPQFAPGMSR